MITLKLRTYNRLELEALDSMLENFLSTCKTGCNIGGRCKVCEYKHICDDITRAKAFIESTLSPGKNA